MRQIFGDLLRPGKVAPSAPCRYRSLLQRRPPREIPSELKTFPIREETAQFADGGKARWKIGEVRLELGWPFANHSGAFWQDGAATAASAVQPSRPTPSRGFPPPPPPAHPTPLV